MKMRFVVVTLSVGMLSLAHTLALGQQAEPVSEPTKAVSEPAKTVSEPAATGAPAEKLAVNEPAKTATGAPTRRLTRIVGPSRAIGSRSMTLRLDRLDPHLSQPSR